MIGPGRDEDRGAPLEAASDALLVVDGAGLVRAISARAEVLFGYRRRELLGQPAALIVPHRQCGTFCGRHPLHHCENAPQGLPWQGHPAVSRLQLCGVRKDGHEFPIELTLSTLRDDGGVLGFAAIRDISARAADRQTSELAALVRSSRDAILSKTLDGTITFWNSAAERLYGYTAEEAIGMNVSMLAPPGHKAEIASLLRRLARGEHIENHETIRVTREGRLLDVDVTLWPVRDSTGTIIGGCAIVRELTERLRAQELTRLYEQQRQLALTVQHTLMGTPGQVPIQTAGRYLPATRGPGVGGDWFDLIPLPGGRVGMLIGDVMGRGLEAATVMGQLRAVSNALAKTDLPPAELMQRLDAVLCDMPAQMATCCYLVVDPETGEATVCSAGHLPVLIICADHTVHPLPAPISMPLGVGGIATQHSYQQAQFTLPSACTLALYTDGLVETRTSDLDTRLITLEATLALAARHGLSLDKTADSVLSTLLADASTYDDVTLLLARLPAMPIAIARTDLPAQPAAVADARQFCAATLACWAAPRSSKPALTDNLIDTAVLLTSEIVTNAVRHAHGPINLSLRHSERELTIQVSDRSTQLPHVRVAGPDDESGRGLYLVEALADDWGSHPRNDGKTIWCTLSTTTDDR
ncbi:ATP-binding SpoIIE family protein phosphatase [Actinomadura rudentiformis]|uniref:MEKHLA domain-containing protein n=1 Tax=Actinomadura rudentiformis TaxID=359158 RepID=A0A6H9YM24_9ACTN|nr:SpoIIE family protein phosphatase [Actinomadura rudentiformis]KAB2340616.1 MEKHLA domain-containing protein [Actinomadura rudentiformis]